MKTRTKLPPELETLVNTIIDSVLALAAGVSKPEFEQQFEFAWEHSDSLHQMLPMTPSTKAPDLLRPYQKDRARCPSQNPIGDTANDPTADSRAPVGCHDNEIKRVSIGIINDLISGVAP